MGRGVRVCRVWAGELWDGWGKCVCGEIAENPKGFAVVLVVFFVSYFGLAGWEGFFMGG